VRPGSRLRCPRGSCSLGDRERRRVRECSVQGRREGPPGCALENEVEQPRLLLRAEKVLVELQALHHVHLPAVDPLEALIVSPARQLAHTLRLGLVARRDQGAREAPAHRARIGCMWPRLWLGGRGRGVRPAPGQRRRSSCRGIGRRRCAAGQCGEGCAAVEGRRGRIQTLRALLQPGGEGRGGGRRGRGCRRSSRGRSLAPALVLPLLPRRLRALGQRGGGRSGLQGRRGGCGRSLRRGGRCRFDARRVRHGQRQRQRQRGLSPNARIRLRRRRRRACHARRRYHGHRR